MKTNVTPKSALSVTARVHQLIRGQCDGRTVAQVVEIVSALEMQVRDLSVTLTAVRAGRDLIASSNLELAQDNDALTEQLQWARTHLAALCPDAPAAGEQQKVG